MMSQSLGAFANGWAIDTTAPVASDLRSPDRDITQRHLKRFGKFFLCERVYFPGGPIEFLLKLAERFLKHQQLIIYVMRVFEYHPVLKAFLAGSFSGTFSTILFQPLDLVKTRLQNPGQHVVAATVNGRIQPGMITIFVNIVRQEQVIGLWRGMVPSIARCVPGVGLYFSSLHWLKTKLGKTSQELGAMEAVVLGMIARTMSGVALIPITVIKTRYESGLFKYNSLGGALKSIYKAEGFRGLSCGLGPTLARDAPFSGLYLMFYTQAKQAIPKECLQSPATASIVHFSCGVVAGIAASLATNPADVLKTNMQLYPDKFPNAFSAAVYVHQTYGVKGYFKGAVPRMLRRTLMAAMAWTVFEEITRSIGLK